MYMYIYEQSGDVSPKTCHVHLFISLRDSIILLPPRNTMLHVSFIFRPKFCYASDSCVLSFPLCIPRALGFVIHNDVTFYLDTPDGSSDARSF